MRLIVFIGEEHQVFQFEKNQVLVGSDPRCDIELNYEGVGRTHLRFVEKGGEYFLQDLKSGFKTEVNQRVMKPGSAIKINFVFPVEIGGILLKLEDESDDAPIFDENSLFDNEFDDEFNDEFDDEFDDEKDQGESEDDSADEASHLLNEINKSFEQKHSGEREKFKPNLLSGISDTESTGTFKISENQLSSGPKESFSQKVGSKKVNARKSRKKLNKVNVQSNTQRFSLGTIVALGLILLVASWIFYTKHFNAPKTEVKKAVVEKDLILKPTKISKVTEDNRFLQTKIQTKGCLTDKEICLAINPEDTYQSAESIQRQGKSISVFMRIDSLNKSRQLLAPTQEDEARIKEVIIDEYIDSFDYESFVNAGSEATDINLQYKAQDYKFHLLMTAKLLNQSLVDVLKKEELLDVTVYGLDIDIDGKFQIQHFLNITKESLIFNLQRKEKLMQDFRLVLNNSLSKNLEQKFSYIGATEFNDYNSDKAEDFLVGKKLNRFQELHDMPKCKEAWEAVLCEQLLPYTKRSSDGVVQVDDDLVVSVDTSSVFENFKDRYRENYTSSEFRGLISFFQKADTNGMEGWKNFKDSNFFVKDLRYGQVNLAETFILLTDTQVLEELNNREELKNLVLISYKGDNAKLLVTLKIPKEKIPQMETLKEWTRVFWKSNLDLFTPLAKSSALEFVVQ